MHLNGKFNLGDYTSTEFSNTQIYKGITRQNAFHFTTR